MMLIDPFRGGVQGPAMLSFIAFTAGSDTDGAGVVSFPGIAVGTEAAGRRLIAAIHYQAASLSLVPIGISANGNAGVISIVGEQAVTPDHFRTAIGCAAVPAGSTADITVTFSGPVFGVRLGLYLATNVSTDTAADTASSSTTTHDGAVNCDQIAEGVIVAAGVFGSPITFGGITQTYDNGAWFGGGGNTTPTASPGALITCNGFASGGAGVISTLIAASFR